MDARIYMQNRVNNYFRIQLNAFVFFRLICLLLVFPSIFNISLATEVSDEFIVSYRLDSAPMQFQNSDGQADGILIDFWKLWSQKSGIKLVFKGAYNKQAQAMVAEGHADFNAGLFSNEGREKHLVFSEPILKSPYHIFVNNSYIQNFQLNKIDQYVVGVTRGSFHENYMRKNFPNVKLQLFDGYQSMFTAADAGKLHVFISQPMFRRYYLNKHSLIDKFTPLNQALYIHSYKAAAEKNNIELIRKINQSIALIGGDEKSNITRKWLGLQWHSSGANQSVSINLTAEEKQWINDHKVIRIGGESNWPPFDFIDENGNYRGVTADYIKLLEKRIGVSIDVLGEQSWTETLDMLKAGEIDAIGAISKTLEREKFAKFTTSYVTYPYAIVAHVKNTQFNNIKSLTGKRVSVEKNFYTHLTLASQYPEINLVVEETSENAILAVAQGKSDAYIGVQPVASYFIEKNIISNLRVTGLADFEKVGISMATRLDNPVLVQILQKGLDSITPVERLSIQRKWINISQKREKNKRVVHLSEQQKKWLGQHKFIRIGVDPRWPPVEYIDDKGIYSGIASDYVDDLEKQLSIDVKYDPTLKWSEVIDKIKAGEIDVLPAVSKTSEREKYLNFTKPYLKFPYVIFTRDDTQLITGIDELSDKTIVVERDYANHEILKQNHPDIRLLLVDDTEQALRELSLNNADAYVGNLAVTSHIILQTGLANIKVAAPTPYSNDIAFAVRKGIPELVNILQIFLDSISVEQSNAFKKKWFSIQYEHNVDYSIVWKMFGISLFVVLVIAFWLLYVQKQKEALRISDERFRLVMNATQEGIWDWDLELNKAYYSPGFYSMLGYAVDSFSKNTDAWMELLHPDDYEKTSNRMEKILEDCEKRYNLEFRIRHKNGQYRNAHAMGSLEFNKQGKAVRSLGSITDVTEKKLIEEQIKKNEQQLKSIIDGIPLAIIISSDDGTIVFANRHTQKEIGSDQSVIGLNMNDFYEQPDDRDNLFKAYKEKGRIESIPMRYKTFSGAITEGIVSIMPIYFDGEIKNLGVLVNLSERMQMERELIAAKVQADIANNTKSSFLANMSHEIRTPMNAIIGLSNLALNTQLTDQQIDYLEKIVTSSHSLLGIINDILDFSKIEAGKLEIEKIEFDLESVIDNLSSLIMLKAEEKDLEVVFVIDPEVPLNLLGDPLRLGQILINLTQNAIKFTDSGEVVITIQQVEKLSGTAILKFSVSDTGIGIPRNKVEHLFDSFSQVDETYSRRFEGTGLGLAICKQLVELMGGSIHVESEVDIGSTFSYQLKFELVKIPKINTGDISFKGKKVLVVDDNLTAREALSRMLTSFAFDVSSVASGLEAFNLVKMNIDKNNQQFDILLIDFKMPGLDGIQTSNKINNEINLHIPSIIMSSPYARDGVMAKEQGINFDGVLMKPINASMLFNAMVEVLQGAVLSHKNLFTGLPNRRLSGEILLVEDNSINQQVAQEILENMGLFVQVASNGKTALSALEEHTFDLIITDIQMPEMDGFELTRIIRNHEKFHSIPILAMTAHAMEKDRKKCLSVGMNDHISKPIDSEKLLNTLSYWLNSHKLLVPPQVTLENGTSKSTHISGLDIDWGLKQIGGNKQLFCKLLNEFVQDYENTEEIINNAIKDKNIELIQRVIHTIHGISGSIGARDLLNATVSIKNELHKNCIPDENTWNIFNKVFTDVTASIKQWLEHENINCQNINQTLILDTALLDRIYILLNDGNPEVEKIITSISTDDLNLETVEMISIILKNIQNYDYSRAKVLVEQLLLSIDVKYKRT